MNEELIRLRQEIDDVDEQIIKLLAYRLKLSRKIGKIKLSSSTFITDENRENRVKENWISNARKYNIPESLIESILPIIFSYSKLMQINAGEKERIIIYGYGGMARSLTTILLLAGHEVTISGRDLNKAEILAKQLNCASMPISQALSWGEIIILAIPPSAIMENIASLANKLTNKIVMDISSSKNNVYKYMEEFSKKFNFKYISIHPLFGPIDYPVGERIIIIPSETSTKQDIERIESLWRNAGLVTLISDVDTHEKAMAIVQVLTHYYLLGLSNSIDLLSKEFMVDLSNFHTTNFREISKVLNKVKDLEEVIMEIQSQNPYAYKVREIGLEVLKKIKEKLERGQKNDTVYSER
ncbi:MAG: chorismate mutase [Saccharolobus sp.]